MKWFGRATQLVDDAAAMTDTVRQITSASPRNMVVGIPSYSEFQGMRALWAMQVPAYAKGVTLISGTIAQLPFTQWESPTEQTAAFLAQPEAGRAAWVTKQRTVLDLIQHARAYWQIVGVTAGRVTIVKQLPAETITEQADGTLTMDGAELTRSNPQTPPVKGQVIVFTGNRDGTLILGVDVISTALALELASFNYAESPHPGDVLRNVSNFEMSDEEITTMLAGWKAARAEGSVAYLNGGVELADPKGWSPTELALVEQHNQSAIQIARLLNLDAMWLGASVSGSNLTYQNRVDARADLYGFTLSQYIVPIEQRLSMRDVCGGTVRADSSEFLRANLSDRVSMAIDLVGAGVIDTEEARAFVSDKPTGGLVT